MNINFPELKVGTAFMRNGGLYEVLGLPEKGRTIITVQNLVEGGTLRLNLVALRDEFKKRPGSFEVLPRDLASKEARLASRRRHKGTGVRGRKALDMDNTGIYDWLIANCKTRIKKRYQTSYIMDEGLEVVIYRKTPRIDIAIREGELNMPWEGEPPRGVIKYTEDNPFKKKRPWLSHYICPRQSRNVNLAYEYLRKIIGANVKRR